MLFLDGVGKPRGTTLILSSTLGAGSVERPLCTRTRENSPVWIPCSGDWEREEVRRMQRDVDGTRTKRGEERKGVGGMNERGTEIGGGGGMVGMTGTTRPKGGKLKARAIAGGRTVTSTRYHKPRIQNLLRYSVEILWSQPAPRIIPITQPNLWIPLLIISTSS